MLNWFKRRMRNVLEGGEQSGPRAEEASIEIPVLALLIEMSRADQDVDGREVEQLKSLATSHFHLQGARLQEVLSAAERAADEAVSLFQFTRKLDRAFDAPEKVRIVEMLWRMAAADGRIDKHEEYLVRKIADLLHVSHSQFMRMKHRVLAECDGLQAGD